MQQEREKNLLINLQIKHQELKNMSRLNDKDSTSKFDSLNKN